MTPPPTPLVPLFVDSRLLVAPGSPDDYAPRLVSSLLHIARSGYRMVLLVDDTAVLPPGLVALLQSEGIPHERSSEAVGELYLNPGEVLVTGPEPATVPEVPAGAKHVRLDLQQANPTAALGSWPELAERLQLPPRRTTVERNTQETAIHIELNLDGSGQAEINTGIGFFDHMLHQIARHGRLDLLLRARGDLEVDEHHTIEDVGLALGEAFRKAVGDKRGMERYSFVLPMDEARAEVAMDFSGRSWLAWNASFHREYIGGMPTEMFKHFFHSLADQANLTLHIRADGENEHHKIEAVFKAVGKALRQALRRDPLLMDIPSTKGRL